VTPAWYHWDGEVLRISSPNWTKKVRNIRRDPRVSVCIDDQVSGTYATMFGHAELVEGPDVDAETWPILIKYLHPDEAAVRWRRINADGVRVVIRLRPKRIVWRHSVR
jgi:PPOX class probable F420-dependent enzyme